MFGLKKSSIKKIQSIFEKYEAIESALLYGSRAKGNFRDNSDIDITLIGKTIDLNTLLKVETEIDDLLLPYQIDLSIYNKITNPELLDHIKRIGVIFYKQQQPMANNN